MSESIYLPAPVPTIDPWSNYNLASNGLWLAPTPVPELNWPSWFTTGSNICTIPAAPKKELSGVHIKPSSTFTHGGLSIGNQTPDTYVVNAELIVSPPPVAPAFPKTWGQWTDEELDQIEKITQWQDKYAPPPQTPKEQPTADVMLSRAIPALFNYETLCPARIDCNAAGKLTLSYLIQHLNDHHEWTFTKIADWLDTLDNVDLTFQPASIGD